MGTLWRTTLLCFFSMLFVWASSLSQERDRATIPDKYKWNLAEIYPSDDAWRTAKADLAKETPKIEQYRGTLRTSQQQLLRCLDLVFRIYKNFTRLAVYASMMSDLDTRESRYLGMQQEMGKMGADLGAKAAFIEPEILGIDSATMGRFLSAEPKLGIYRRYIDNIVRMRAHTGTEGEENIIADAGLMGGTAQSINNVFLNAEFAYPEVVLSDGKTVKLTQASYGLYRASPVREDRKKVFAAYFGALNQYRLTLGAQVSGAVNEHMAFAKASKYPSAVDRALDANNIPVKVYRNLVSNVNAHLGTFHRYLALRKRMLGVDTLHYYDLYAPLVRDVDLSYSVDDAEKHILASLAPLGSDYAAVVKKGLNERWVDMYPTAGKQSGAYSNGGAFDVHPYMLMNYNGKYNDMSTLAHELGHTMQSYLSNKAQPYPTARYPTFVAEVASTFNEALLIDHMVKQITDDAARLAILGNYLEGIKGTLFRQTQFAEFELGIHETAERGEALTGDRLNDLYTEITRKYYGHDKGVCVVDDFIKAEWSYISHFYLNFYVYQYATSFTASAALSEQVLAGNKDVTQRYLKFLSAGGSKYPIDLLKDAGVDMRTSQPFELSMKKMNRVMDEMEKILAKMKK